MTGKKIRLLIFLCIAIFIISALGCVWILTRSHGNLVEIIQDGSVIERLDLSEAEDQTIEVVYDGRVNVIQIEDHRICVSEADCPDHTCINMGWLDSSVPIVCLPNHLVIQFVGQETDMDILIQ